MDQDILGRIIEVEREIQERLATEKDKAAVWLGKIRAEAEEHSIREEQILQETFKRAASEARSSNEQKVADLLNEAARYAGKLNALSDDALRKIVEKQVAHLCQKGGQRGTTEQRC